MNELNNLKNLKLELINAQIKENNIQMEVRKKTQHIRKEIVNLKISDERAEELIDQEVKIESELGLIKIQVEIFELREKMINEFLSLADKLNLEVKYRKIIDCCKVSNPDQLIKIASQLVA